VTKLKETNCLKYYKANNSLFIMKKTKKFVLEIN